MVFRTTNALEYEAIPFNALQQAHIPKRSKTISYLAIMRFGGKFRHQRGPSTWRLGSYKLYTG